MMRSILTTITTLAYDGGKRLPHKPLRQVAAGPSVEFSNPSGSGRHSRRGGFPMNPTALFGTVLIALQLAACGSESHRSDAPTATIEPDASVVDDLQFLREEEKLARDVYLTLFEKWHLMPHQKIAASEQTHTDQVKSMLVAYDLPDPVQDDSVGMFANNDLATLYTDLTALGVQSEVASLTVGATVEDLDIRDIEQMKSRTQDPNILSMYAALQCGSRNHLRTFTSQLTMRGVTYSPEYIDQAEYDAILAGANEPCGQ